MDVLFGIQWFPEGGKISNSKKDLEGFSKLLPVGLDLNFPGLEYLLHSSLTLLLPQEWEEATWVKRGPFLLGIVWDTPHSHLSLWNSPLPGVWRRITETWQIINISLCERKGFVTQWLEHHDFLTKLGEGGSRYGFTGRFHLRRAKEQEKCSKLLTIWLTSTHHITTSEFPSLKT